jgi:chemosensory pili system protein ChpA (sensor histidine kinase/response regulator)
MVRKKRMPDAAYFPIFAGELRGYIAELHQQELVIASPTRTGSPIESALRALQRLGHTLAGLGETVALADVALLGAALDEVMSALPSIDPLPAARRIAVPVTYLAMHLEARLGRMQTAGDFLPPDAGEQAEAERVTRRLRDLTLPPAMDPAATISTLSEDAAESYAGDIQGIIDTFLQSNLSRADISFLQSTPPAIPDDHLQLFSDEMSDDLGVLRQMLAQVTSGGNPSEALTQMSLTAHKLKGAAFMAGLPTIGALSDVLETMLIALRQGQATLNAETVRWLIEACDALEAMQTRLAVTRSEDNDTEALARLHEGYAYLMSQAIAAGDVHDTAPLATRAEDEAGQTTNPNLSTVAPHPMLRVAARRLEDVMATLGTMQINLIELARLRGDAAGSEQEIARVLARITELYDRLRAERIAAAAHGLHGAVDPTTSSAGPRRTPVPPVLAEWLEQHRGTPADDQPELEYYSEFDVLMAMVGEAVSDLRAMHLRLQTALNQTQRQQEYQDFLTETIQRDVLALRLAPLTDIVARLTLVVQATAHEEGKVVEFVAEGAENTLDSDIIAVLLDPLVQVTRNAVVHGIEPPDERAAAGKTAPARVRFHAATDGDGVVITISDNGRGINPQRLIASAMLVQTPAGPLLSPERARALSLAEAFDLMFLPDVSTAVEIRPNAGRGMGLPTVRRAIESVQGSVSVSSTPGEGTAFTFRLPPSLSSARAVTVRAGAGNYAVPLRDIRRFIAVTSDDLLTTADGVVRARVADESGATAELPAITLAALLEQDDATPGKTALVVARDHQEYAVIVDDVGDERDLIIRPVPRHLRRRSVRGAAITTTGAALLILDLPDLIAAALAADRFGARPPVLAAPAERRQGDYILVVDDSPSIRHGLGVMLDEMGYATQMARDGFEAIERINVAHPRLIILDVEMPQMNGYELLEVLRAHAPYHDIHAVMLTSRATAQYREHALRLGAVDYLVKPVTSEALHAAIARALLAYPAPVTVKHE